MQGIGKKENIKISNTFNRKNNPLHFWQGLVFSGVTIVRDVCILTVFHRDKCKKYYSVFKNNFIKKILVFIIFKSLVNQGVLDLLIDFYITNTV